jgi:hypothetical protein
MGQLYVALNKNGGKIGESTIKFVVRISCCGQMEEKIQNEVTERLIKIESLIIQAFKVFRKLHYQLKDFSNKLDNIMESGS